MPPTNPPSESPVSVLEPPAVIVNVPSEVSASVDDLAEQVSASVNAPDVSQPTPKPEDPRHPKRPRGPYRPRAPRTPKAEPSPDVDAAKAAAAQVAGRVAQAVESKAACRAAGELFAQGLLGTLEQFVPTLCPLVDVEKGTRQNLVVATGRLFEEKGWSNAPDLGPGWALAIAAGAHIAVMAGAPRHRPALLRARDWVRDKWIGWRRGKR